MFDISVADIAEKARELHFVRDTLEKVLRLIDVLDYMSTNSLMKNTLALKGGTAINLTVFNLPRLSVDIDLDYCGEQSREDMLEARKEIGEDVKTYMTTQGYMLNPDSRFRYSLDSFMFSYKNGGGRNDNLKIEINYSLRSHIFEPVHRPLLSNVVPHKQDVLSVVPLEIYASKINALLDRSAARDLYDSFNMIRHNLFPEELQPLLRKCVVFYTAISQEVLPSPMRYDVSRLDRITLRKVRTDLLPMIHKGEFIELSGMQRTVRDFIGSLMVLTDAEEEFLAAFSRKSYHPDYLFSDPDILRRIERHPMVLWKMQEHS